MTTLFFQDSKIFLEVILEDERFKNFFLRRWVHSETFFLDGSKNVLDDLSSGGGWVHGQAMHILDLSVGKVHLT